MTGCLLLHSAGAIVSAASRYEVLLRRDFPEFTSYSSQIATAPTFLLLRQWTGLKWACAFQRSQSPTCTINPYLWLLGKWDRTEEEIFLDFAEEGSGKKLHSHLFCSSGCNRRMFRVFPIHKHNQSLRLLGIHISSKKRTGQAYGIIININDYQVHLFFQSLFERP